ncbi:MAG: glutathione ABC transporter permease [Firmicutes bacterium ZCTH02-B6]|nr:MAG: glutathione ABC transporter permease [Firmicutes bacterium ZCTH02-B6]
MHRYVLRRLLATIPTLWLMLTFVFFLVRIVPGDPAMAILGDSASAEALERFRQQMGLNDPLPVQYFRFLADIARGNLGTSMVTGLPVKDQLMRALPYTLELTGAGVLIGVVLGVPLGLLSGLKQNSWLDYLIRAVSLAGLSVPAFVLAVVLMMVFSVQLGWFPVISSGSGANLVEHLRQLFLPALTLGLIMTAYVARVTRSSFLNVFHHDYIRTARAKGVAEPRVVVKHALKNALIPVITMVGLYAGVLLGSSVMTEIVFNRPGLSGLIVGAMSRRDYTALQSLLVVFALLVVVINLITDLMYGLVDPRIRYD